MDERPLQGNCVVSLAVNLPGPLTAARYTALGAAVTKVVPPSGDPLAWVSPAWHDALQAGQEVVSLDLKSAGGQTKLAELLAGADALLTSTRPAALARLGLDWPSPVRMLSAAVPRRHRRLSRAGRRPGRPRSDLPGQRGAAGAAALPRIPLADYAGSERAVTALFALLWARERTGRGGRSEVSLAEALAPYADALRYGLLAPGTLLGGGSPLYGLYRAARRLGRARGVGASLRRQTGAWVGPG